MSIELNHSKWKVYNFNDIFTEYSKSNIENLEQFTVGKHGLVPKSSEGYSYDVQKHKIFEPDTLLLGIGAEEVGISTMERGCVSPIYNTFKISDSFDSLFLKYLMPIIISQNKCRISHISTRRNYEIDVSELSKMQIALPPLEIQRKISSLLFDIDNKIENQENLLNKYKNLKSSLLLKLFPMENEDIPKIRFNGFTDTWEQCKLKEVAEFNPKAVLPDTFEYVDLESVIGTDMISHRTENKNTAPSRAQRVAKIGDIFYQTVRPYQKNNYLFNKLENNYIFSTGYAQLRPYINSYFLMSFLQTENFVQLVLDNCTGTSYPTINSTDLSNLTLKLPTTPEEQKQIGILFNKLDNLITLHQRKLDKLKEVKIALLDKLLV
jgi:type I restriction enzyme S subunit